MIENFVVYKHYTKDTNELFYIGEGRPKRANSRHSRNKFWHKIVKKHNGFTVEIVANNLNKEEAQNLEIVLIKKYKKEGFRLANLCEGPMFKKHWLLGTPKEMHPMYGKKSPNQSKRITLWNKEHSGEKSPVWGLKRPDLAERNKNGLFNRKCSKIKCICLNTTYTSLKEAEKILNIKLKHLSRSIKSNQKCAGYYWEYIT